MPNDVAPPVTPPSTTRLSRTVEWFLRRKAAQEALGRENARDYQRACEQRARVALEVGERVLDPSGQWLAEGADRLAAALFTESIGWSMRLSARDSGRGETEDLRPPSQEELASLLTQGIQTLRAAAGSEAAAAELSDVIVQRRFDVVGAAEARRLACDLRGVASRLIRAASLGVSSLEDVYFQRFSRLAVLALAVAALVAGGLVWREGREESADLSRGKPWRASSSYEVSCVSPARSCKQSAYFFHTQMERDPWLELDLQSPQTFSRVRVQNRKDCCAERAVPLVVEVSADRLTWREVARRNEQFETWQARFEPARARWVRVRIDGSAFLHLSAIRILP